MSEKKLDYAKVQVYLPAQAVELLDDIAAVEQVAAGELRRMIFLLGLADYARNLEDRLRMKALLETTGHSESGDKV